MCLISASEELIADKDIVCYKRLEKCYPLPKVCDGDKFTGTISGSKMRGVITVTPRGDIFFCTNNSQANGLSCDDKKGYKYSWIRDNCVQIHSLNGKNLPFTFRTPFRHMTVEEGKTYISLLDKIGTIVEKGLHSYKTKFGVFNEKNNDEVVAKCIIPKGAAYHKGTFSDVDSYASDTLIYITIGIKK